MDLDQTLSIIRQVTEFSGKCLTRARLPKGVPAAVAALAIRSPAEAASRNAPFFTSKSTARRLKKIVPEQDFFGRPPQNRRHVRLSRSRPHEKTRRAGGLRRLFSGCGFLKKRPQAFACLDAGKFDRHAFREVTHHAAAQMVEQNGRADRRAHVDIDGGTRQ